MQNVAAENNIAGVNAELEFCRDNNTASVALVNSIGEGLDKRTGNFVRRDVFIRNGRLQANRFDLDREGFALMRQGTEVSDFYNDDEVQQIYYPEMENLLKKVTGAAKALIFDHTRRIDDNNALTKKMPALRQRLSTMTSPSLLPNRECGIYCQPKKQKHG